MQRPPEVLLDRNPPRFLFPSQWAPPFSFMAFSPVLRDKFALLCIQTHSKCSRRSHACAAGVTKPTVVVWGGWQAPDLRLLEGESRVTGYKYAAEETDFLKIGENATCLSEVKTVSGVLSDFLIDGAWSGVLIG